MQAALLVISLAVGWTISYVDSRPTWDDTGITALALFVASGLCGAMGPKRPWLWALTVGCWIPVRAIVTAHNFSALLAMLFAFAGAYAGMACRKKLFAA